VRLTLKTRRGSCYKYIYLLLRNWYSVIEASFWIRDQYIYFFSNPSSYLFFSIIFVWCNRIKWRSDASSCHHRRRRRLALPPPYIYNHISGAALFAGVERAIEMILLLSLLHHFTTGNWDVITILKNFHINWDLKKKKSLKKIPYFILLRFSRGPTCLKKIRNSIKIKTIFSLQTEFNPNIVIYI